MAPVLRAYPALAEDGHGWEKVFSERMRRHFHTSVMQLPVYRRRIQGVQSIRNANILNLINLEPPEMALVNPAGFVEELPAGIAATR